MHVAIMMTMGNEAARVLKLSDNIGTLKTGAPADVAILDLDTTWIIDRNRVQSKSKNTPFHGRKVQSKAAFTLVGGRVIDLRK